MPTGRSIKTITDQWVQIASGAAVFTVQKEGKGTLKFNNSADDSTASNWSPSKEEQFDENEARPTFARATGVGWELLVDGEL